MKQTRAIQPSINAANALFASNNQNFQLNPNSIKPNVSVIIPTYNEGKFIDKCMRSILNQDYPKDKYEIILVDGRSSDDTCEIVKHYMQRNSQIRLISDESGKTSNALNIGIHHARNEIIIRMDGHAEAPQSYISKSVNYLLEIKPDIVGCHAETLGMGYWGYRIQLALTSCFGVGNVSFRVSQKETWNEPAWLGTFWRETIVKMEGFDETFSCNEDDEFSYRMLYGGHTIYIPSDISCKYYCRSTLSSLWHQYYKFGLWKVSVIYKLRKLPAIRHIIPLLFLSTLAVLSIGGIYWSLMLNILFLIISAYLVFLVVGSCSASKRKPNICFLSIIPAFVVLHFSYGVGFLWGVLSCLVTSLKGNGNKACRTQ